MLGKRVPLWGGTIRRVQSLRTAETLQSKRFEMAAARVLSTHTAEMGCLSTNLVGHLDVLDHNGDALGMDAVILFHTVPPSQLRLQHGGGQIDGGQHH